jgi:hypothetical protein
MVTAALQRLLSSSTSSADKTIVDLRSRLQRWQRIAATKTTPAEAGAFFPRRAVAGASGGSGVTTETPAHAVLAFAAQLVAELCAALDTQPQAPGGGGGGNGFIGRRSSSLHEQLDELEAQALARGVSSLAPGQVRQRVSFQSTLFLSKRSVCQGMIGKQTSTTEPFSFLLFFFFSFLLFLSVLFFSCRSLVCTRG